VQSSFLICLQPAQAAAFLLGSVQVLSQDRCLCLDTPVLLTWLLTYVPPPPPLSCVCLRQVSLDYEDDGRSMSSETRSVVEEEVKALLQVGGRGVGGYGVAQRLLRVRITTGVEYRVPWVLGIGHLEARVSPSSQQPTRAAL
jgi:hypothetical protein